MFSCRQRTYPVVSDMELCHPEDYEDEEFMELSSVAPELEVFSCDPCDKNFPFKEDYEIHMLQHKVCNLDGCTFSAHEKIIEKHIRLQHSTGLYDKIRNINTPEDIQKWIEDRRKRYPNVSNIQRRYEEQEEQFKRGERIIKNQKRFGENKYRSIKIRNKKRNVRQAKIKRKKTFKAKTEKSLICTENIWNKMFPFKGTLNLYERDVHEDVEEEKYEDDEWNTPASSNVVVLKNALGALMGAYMSGDESDEITSPKSLTKNDIIMPQKGIFEKESSKTINEHVIIETNKYDDEPPTEIGINRSCTSEHLDNIESGNMIKVNKRKRKIKKCETNFKTPQFCLRKQKITLLEKLLENDIRRERNILLQCIRHIINTNFFLDK